MTGAAGFVGGHLVAALVARGETVRALVRSESDSTALAALGVDVVRGDIRDRHAVERAVAGTRVVYHLARSPRDVATAREREQIDVGGTVNVARAAAASRIERVVFASSSSVYGALRDRAIDEQTPARPYSSHGRAKLRAEAALTAFAAEAVSTVIVRLPHVYGWGSRSLSLFSLIGQGRLRVSGSGSNHVHPIAVEDVVDGLVLCASTPAVEPRLYNLAAPAAVTVDELTELIRAHVDGRRIPRTRLVPPFALVRRTDGLLRRLGGGGLPRMASLDWFLSDRIFDLTRARIELGFAPSVSVAASVAATADWYRQTEGAQQVA